MATNPLELYQKHSTSPQSDVGSFSVKQTDPSNKPILPKGFSYGENYIPQASTTLQSRDVSIKDLKTFPEYNVDMRFGQMDWFDQRAQNQSAGEQVWNGALRLVGTTATKVMSGLGYLGGAVGALATWDISTMTDNGFSAYFDGLEKDIKEGAAIYKPSWVENGGFYDKVRSLSFWMDEGVDGAAFMASAMIPGLGVAKGLQLGTRIARIIGSGAKTAGLIDNAIITTMSTVSEAAVEAKGVQNRVRQELQSQVERGLMTPEQMEIKAAEAARNDFLINAAILVGPNILQSKWFFGNAIKSAEKNVLNKIVDQSGKLITDTGPVTKNLIAKNLLKKMGTGFVVEGMEENAQLATENWAVDNAVNPEEDNNILKNIVENFTTTEGQVSMFLGGIMGLGGGVVGGIRSGIAEKKSITRAQKHLTSISDTYVADLKNTLKDIYEKETITDPDGSTKEVYKKDSKGNLIANKEKVKEVMSKLETNQNLETLKQYALLKNQKDLFETLQNISFSNLAIEHLMYGEGSLEVLNKRIDSLAEENKKEYTEIFGILGDNDARSIDEAKEQQKEIAKVIYESLEREKDYSGVWNTPEFKNKEELQQYDAFTQAMIGNKALADARIAFANRQLSKAKQKIEPLKSKVNNLEKDAKAIESHLDLLNNLNKILDKNNLSEEDQTLKDTFQRDSYNGNNISKKDINKEIKRAETELNEIKGYLPELQDQLELEELKIEKLTETRDTLGKDYGNLTNKSLRDKIHTEWKNKKEAILKAAEQAKKEEAKAAQEKDNEENKPGGKTQVNNTIRDLDKEIADTENELQAILETEDPSLTEEISSLQDKLRNLRAEKAAVNNGTKTPKAVVKNRVNKSNFENYKEGDDIIINGETFKFNHITDTHLILTDSTNELIAFNLDDLNSTTITPITSNNIDDANSNNPELDPTHTAFNSNVINDSVGNNLESEEQEESTIVGNVSNVVMHKEMESTSIRLPNNKKLFYFTTDQEGRPIKNNKSNVDFEYINNSTSLQPGTEVEYRLVEVDETRQKEIDASINSSISKLKEAKKQGVTIDESNNFGFGNSETIGIFSEDKLIGFVQLPKAIDTSDPRKIQNGLAVRESIISERKAILEKLKKGEKVTTTVNQKGKGNFISNKKANQVEFNEADKFDGVILFAYFDGNQNRWIIPNTPGASKKNIKKQLIDIENSIQKGTGKNGQVAMLVRTANGSYEKIPVFTNKLTEDQINEIINILASNKELEAAEYIKSLNHLVFASLGTKSFFRIFGEKGNIKLEIGGNIYKLNDLDKNISKVKEDLADLKQNLTGGSEGIKTINTTETQKRFIDNNTLSTPAILVDGVYFHQPFISLKSIIPQNTTSVDPTKALNFSKITEEQKEHNKKGIQNFLKNAPLKSSVKTESDHYIITKPDGTKIKVARVTSITSPNMPNNIFLRMGAKIGTAFDTFGREYLAGTLLDKNGKINKDSAGYKAVLSIIDNNNQKKIDSIIKAFLSHMETFKQSFPSGTIFHTEERVLYQETNTIENFDGIGGTMDILVELPNGVVEIHDLKALSTSSLTSFSEAKENGISSKERYSRQLNSYAILLYNQYGIAVSSLNLSIMQTSHDTKNKDYEKAPLKYANSATPKSVAMTSDVKVNGKVVLSYKTNIPVEPKEITVNIESKKADIERRRQEELLGGFKIEDKRKQKKGRGKPQTKLVVNKDGTKISFQGYYEGMEDIGLNASYPIMSLEEFRNSDFYKNLKPESKEAFENLIGEYDDVHNISLHEIEISENEGDVIGKGNSTVNITIHTSTGNISDISLTSNTSKINAKYDAELKALEQQPTTSNQSEIEGQVGTSNYSIINGLIFYNNPNGTVRPILNPDIKNTTEEHLLKVIKDDIERRRQEELQGKLSNKDRKKLEDKSKQRLKDLKEISEYGNTLEEALENLNTTLIKSNPVPELRRQGLIDEEIDNHPLFKEYKRKQKLIDDINNYYSYDGFEVSMSSLIKNEEKELLEIPNKKRRVINPEKINAKYDAELAALESQTTVLDNNPAVQAALNDDSQTGVDLQGLTGINPTGTTVSTGTTEKVTLNNKEYTIQPDGKILNSKGKEVKDENEINRISYEIQEKRGLAFTFELNKKQKVKVLVPLTNNIIDGKPSIKLVSLRGEELGEDLLDIAKKSVSFRNKIEELYKKIC